MEKFLSATMLMPLLINQEFAEQLIDRFLKASDHQKQKIIENASELNQKPIVQEFHFPTKATKTKNKLRHFKGYATATETVLGKAGFIKKEVEMEMSLIEDIEGRFEFILQCDEDSGYIVACKVTPELRGKGLFSTMVGAITRYAFSELGLRFVSGSARPPRDEANKDWRCVREPYRTNFKSGEKVILTRLHQLWLSQPYAVHSRVLGIDDEDGFALLSPKHLAGLPIDEIANLDKYHPKKEENSFVYLMRQKGAVA
ncbi:hypothetical protein N9Z68_00255 [Akkermansiaceae bacterium]|nr:hypothetical protein [Akkermansiaceae bacterium]